ncbi:hypothetical protein Tco_0662583 [Tanacetum coccineum]
MASKNLQQMSCDIVKLERLDSGSFLKGAEKRMQFLLATLKLVFFSLSLASIIDKLPPTWKDVKKKLKHRKDDMSLMELGKHLLVKEKYRLENKTNDDGSKVHVVEEKGESSKSGEKRKQQDDKGKDKSKKNKKDVVPSLTNLVSNLSLNLINSSSLKAESSLEKAMLAEEYLN